MACSNCEYFTKDVQTTTLPENMLVSSDCNNGALLGATGCKVTCKSGYQITPTLPKLVYLTCSNGEFVFNSDGKETPKIDIGCFLKTSANFATWNAKENGGGKCTNDDPYPVCYKKGGSCKNEICSCNPGYKGDMCEYFYNFKNDKIIRYSIAFDIKRGGGKCDSASEEVQCNGHGKCDSTSQTCECSFGYTNLHCQDENDDVAILIGSLVGGLAFIGILFVVYYYFCSRNGKGRRVAVGQQMATMKTMLKERLMNKIVARQQQQDQQMAMQAAQQQQQMAMQQQQQYGSPQRPYGAPQQYPPQRGGY